MQARVEEKLCAALPRQFEYHDALGLSVSACANLQLEPSFVLQFLGFKLSSFYRDCQGPRPNRRCTTLKPDLREIAMSLTRQATGSRLCHPMRRYKMRKNAVRRDGVLSTVTSPKVTTQKRQQEQPHPATANSNIIISKPPTRPLVLLSFDLSRAQTNSSPHIFYCSPPISSM